MEKVDSYRFNINTLKNKPVKGILRQDIQGLTPDIVGKKCFVSWGSYQLEMSNRIVNAVGMIADGSGTSSKDLVITSAVSALVLGPVGTTGTLVIAGSGNTATKFTVNSATSITLGTAQTWTNHAVITIGHIDNGSDTDLLVKSSLSIHTNFQDITGNSELLKIDHSKTQSFSNSFKYSSDTYQGNQPYLSYVQPYIEVFLTDDFLGKNILNTANPLDINVHIDVIQF